MAYEGPHPLPVPSGGTGDASFTAYSVVCGGTTSTGALQNVSGIGTSGQVLTSNGAAMLPTWQASSGGGGFTTINIQTFSGSGTYTPTAGMKYCIIQCQAGGGAGGGATATGGSQYSEGSGGGAGEYAVGTFSAASIGASKAVTIGAGGIGASGTTGGNGGNTSVGLLISSNGGIGGTTIAATTIGNVVGGAGGTGGSGGSYRLQGGGGGFSYISFSASIGVAGPGGISHLGATGAAIGSNGTGFGSGGYGAGNATGASAKAGGNGAGGIVIITEYI